MADQEPQQQIQIQMSEDVAKGRYANLASINWSPEEFTLDFALIHPSGGQMVSRVVMSPGHVKRLAETLQRSLTAYEGQVGQLQAAQEPKGELGFKTGDNNA